MLHATHRTAAVRHGPCLLAGLLWLAAAQAQDGQPSYTNQPDFGLPFVVDESEGPRWSEVQLHLTTDGGRNWRQHATARPSEQRFPFTAPGDGEYGFLVRTVDRQGNAYPPQVRGLPPEVVVVVDTAAPQVTLRPVQAPGGRVGVSWRIEEANLDPASPALEYRTRTDGAWLPVPDFTPAAEGQADWDPQTGTAVQVRLRVADRAGNTAIGERTLPAGGGIPAISTLADRTRPQPPAAGAGPFMAPAQPAVRPLADIPTAAAATPLSAIDGPPGQGVPVRRDGAEVRTLDDLDRHMPRKVVGDVRFDIEYDVTDVGKSGLQKVVLYYSLDNGRTWESYGEDEDQLSPFPVEVTGEGLYPFRMNVVSGVGLGDPPPGPGAEPELWVEVDLTPPAVTVPAPETGDGPARSVLTISWQATDRNLTDKPITLEWSEDRASWRTVAENVENLGRYQWKMPPELPFRFHIRVSAADRAGNVGSAATAEPVLVDHARPKLRILGVQTRDEGF